MISGFLQDNHGFCRMIEYLNFVKVIDYMIPTNSTVRLKEREVDLSKK
jgi:hypothetical protein